MSFTILGGMSDYLPLWPWVNISVALSSSGSCLQLLPITVRTRSLIYTNQRVSSFACACVRSGGRANMRSPSPPTVPPLKHWAMLLPLLWLIDRFIVRSVFTPRTVHWVTRQTLVKCGDPETFSLRDAMSISSTAIFHRKPKEARVTTFSCGHKQWDYADEVWRFLRQPKTLPWQPMETQ